MKKVLVLCLVLSLCVTAFGACAESEWRFERPVEIVCPFGSDSGVDTALRTLRPVLKKELGTSIIVNNQLDSSA